VVEVSGTSFTNPLRPVVIIRPRKCTNRILEERRAVSESSVMLQKNDGTHKDVNVTVNVFSEAVEDDIGSLS